MSASTMYSLPLTATVGEAGYVDDVFASPGAHQANPFMSLSSSSNNINNEDMLSPDLYYGSQTCQPSTTASPHTTASNHSATQVVDRTFVNAGPATLSQPPRSRPSPTSSDSASSSDRGLPNKAARYSGNAASASSSASHLAERGDRRQRNTEAARRYRQRKLDRVTELEEALAAVSKERDEFKMNLARAEAEVEVLRSLMKG